MLKRHLRTAYNLTPEEYRAKWRLPPDYPMVAPNYSKQRSDRSEMAEVVIPRDLFADILRRIDRLRRPDRPNSAPSARRWPSFEGELHVARFPATLNGRPRPQTHPAASAPGPQMDRARAAPAAAPQKPKVPIRRSVTPDFIICLEDGKKAPPRQIGVASASGNVRGVVPRPLAPRREAVRRAGTPSAQAVGERAGARSRTGDGNDFPAAGGALAPWLPAGGPPEDQTRNTATPTMASKASIKSHLFIAYSRNHRAGPRGPFITALVAPSPPMVIATERARQSYA